MRRRAFTGCALAAIAASAIAVPLTQGSNGEKRATETVTVGDDYYAPTQLKVKKGTKVKWVWSPDNLDTHDVHLTSKHPDGVKPKDFDSSDGAIGITFARKFKKIGKYGFICTYHKTVMKLDLTVTK